MRIHVDRTWVNFPSLESLFSVFETPIIHNTLCLPPLPLQKRKRINYCFQMLLLRRTAYSLDQEHLKTTTYAKFRGVNRLYYKGLKLLYNISMTHPRNDQWIIIEILDAIYILTSPERSPWGQKKVAVVERRGCNMTNFVRGVRNVGLI